MKSGALWVSGGRETATCGRISLARFLPTLRAQTGRLVLNKLLAALVLGLAACGQGRSASHCRQTPNTERRWARATSASPTFPSSPRQPIGSSASLRRQASSIEMHGSVSAGSQASMKRLETVPLPAGETVIFGPKGMHLMVFGPKPLAARRHISDPNPTRVRTDRNHPVPSCVNWPVGREVTTH